MPKEEYNDQVLKNLENLTKGISRLNLRRVYSREDPRHTLDLEINAYHFELITPQLNIQRQIPHITIETWAVNGNQTQEIRGDEYLMSYKGNLVSHENHRFNGSEWHHKSDKKLGNLKHLNQELKSMLQKVRVPYPLSIHPTVLALMHYG
ncbi:hypothetical protein HOE04_01180 [archaeon]|jgi:hypothetical protein|nr:hypothetical protein [archaeon]